MDPLTLALGAGAIGAGTLGTVFGGLAQSGGSKNAMNYQKGATSNALMNQFRQQALQEQYGRPYAEVGLQNLPYLQYLTTGQMPDVQQLSEDEMGELADLSGQYNELLRQRNLYSSSQTGNRKNQRRYAGIVSDIDAKLGRLSELQNRQRQAQAAQQIQGGGLLQESPMYQWQQQQGEKALNRQLAARGRGNSTFGVNALTDFQRALGAQEAEKQYGRIGGLVDLGRSGTNTYLANLRQTAGDIGNISLGAGQQAAQNALASGEQRASLYQGLGQLPLNALGAYQNYQLGQNLGQMYQPNQMQNALV